jgi:hypothetical protein
VPSIGSRDVTGARRSAVGNRENALQPLDFSNALFGVHPSQYLTERQGGQSEWHLHLWNSCLLRIGYSLSIMTDDERMQRESSLIATIRKNLPDFAKACADDTELVLLHQDAFAADYQEDEYALLGMAVKYAGLRGKEVRVIGKNRSSLGEQGTTQ